MSSGSQPEFFFDRSLGKRSAQLLRKAGYEVHLVADLYPNDAQEVPDQEWIADGCQRGWLLLTKDQRIRYRGAELAALEGRMFCLAAGNLSVAEAAQRFIDAMPAIIRAAALDYVGFWKVYGEGRIRQGWP